MADGSELATATEVQVVTGALDLDSAQEVWSLYLSDKAELTRKNYELDLRSFADFVGQPDATSALAWWFQQGAAGGNKAVHAYKAHLLQADLGDGKRGYAPATIRRRIYALKAVLKRARIYEMVTWDIDIDLPDPETQRNTRGPEPEDYAAVLECLDSAITRHREENNVRSLELVLRDRVLVRLLHDSGLRRTETTGIEWPNGVRLTGREPSVLVLGKGRRRHQWLPLSTRCRDQIVEYLEVRGREAGYLLRGTGSSAGRIDKSTVNRRVSFWAAAAGIPFTPHGLRHTALTTALDHEPDKRKVRQWSRHKSDASLDIYDDRRRQDDRRLAEILSDPSKAEPHS